MGEPFDIGDELVASLLSAIEMVCTVHQINLLN